MSWVTILWSLGAGISLALAALHVLVWFQNRQAWASLAFALTALAATEHAAVELVMMHASSPAAWGEALRWVHVGSFTGIVSSMLFIQLYLRSGRWWLLYFTVGLRFAVVVLNFALDPNINYREIRSLRHIPFLGEQVAVLGDGTINPLMLISQFGLLLWFLFAADATIRLWRRGNHEERRKALVVGGGTALFIFLGAGQAVLSLDRIIDMPMISSMAILCMVLAMGYELSRDVISASRLARELRVTEQRLSLAASAARVILWEWRVKQDHIWASTENLTASSDLPPDQPTTLGEFGAVLHPDDREAVLGQIREAAERSGSWATEYRRVMRDGSLRWFAGRGSMERDAATGEPLMRGISVDITERRKVDDEINRQRGELAHLSRVASLGELSGSLAHEINQPLAIILSNAQAAQRLLAQDPPDVTEVREIITDIINADKRAGEVIKRLRALLKHGESERKPLAISGVIDEVIALMRSDFMTRGVHYTQEKPPAVAVVSGDHIALQQVLLNLFTNACDAMAENPPATRQLAIATRVEGAKVQVSIRDMGCGLPADAGKIFEPFFTTKAHGLGMGLPICRTIITAHGGRLWADAFPAGGAIFHLELPLAGVPP